MSETERALRAAFACLQAIGEGCPSPGEFARRGVRHLPSLVPSEVTTLSLCDLATGRRRVVSDPPHAISRDERAALDLHFRDIRSCASTSRDPAAACTGSATR